MTSAVLAVAMLIAGGCSMDRSDPARAFIEALQAHDVEGAADLLAEGFVFRDEASTFRYSREDVRRMLEWDAVLDERLIVAEEQIHGDTLTCVLEGTNRFFELLELEPYRVHVSFVRDGDRLREEIVHSSTFDPQALEQALKPVAAWAAGARPDALTRLYPEGRLTYDGANARGWLALLTEWRGMAEGADGESAPLN